MYGFGDLGEVEVEIWSDVTIAGQTTNEQKGKTGLRRLTYNCAHLWSTKEKKEENIWRRKIYGEGKYFSLKGR